MAANSSTTMESNPPLSSSSVFNYWTIVWAGVFFVLVFVVSLILIVHRRRGFGTRVRLIQTHSNDGFMEARVARLYNFVQYESGSRL